MTQIMKISMEEELKKNPELKNSDIDDLKEWCKKQPHLPEISDSELIIFLHSNYYHVESAKSTIDSFFTTRTHVPEFFQGRDPIGNKDLRKIFHITSAIPLKELTKEGYHIILLRIMHTDTSNYIFDNSVKHVLMAIELWLYSSGIIKGHILLFDNQNITMGHATRISPSSLKKFVQYLQDGLPVRLKGFHFINANTPMNFILRIAKNFMKKELKDMIYIHSTLESMNEFIPIEALPNELGGKAGPITELHEAEVKKLENHRDWFLEDELRARVDESKRPKKVKSHTQKSTVVTDSFKNKLDID